nr:MAG TPA: tail tape measure protein [Caudoviricetes sp.]
MMADTPSLKRFFFILSQEFRDCQERSVIATANEVSIVMKMVDDVTSTMKSIAGASQSLNKEFEYLQGKAKALGTRYESLRQNSAKCRTEADSLKKQMRELRKAINDGGEGAETAAESYQRLVERYDTLMDAAKGYSEAARSTVKDINSVADAVRKLSDTPNPDPEPGIGPGIGQLTKGLRNSGLIKEAGSAVSGFISAEITSALGQPAADALSKTISGTISGAAAGSIAGPVGAAVGAAIGTAAGALNAYTGYNEKRDDAFKSYVQNAHQNRLSEQDSSLTTGSEIAAGRETDKISFATLFGDADTADSYLSDLVDMANLTPFLYDDLTAMSKTLATYKYGEDEILPVLKTIGDTGAALGQSTSDMTMVATALGRMRSSGKTTLEYLNILNDRGIGAVGMLSDAYGVDQGTMYDMISKGQVEGGKAAEIILQAMADSFAGSMENQSKTFSGLTSTVEGLTQELDNAMGEGYNEGRKAGLQAQRDWLSGESGAAVMEANKAIGAWKAELENSKEQYIRDAVDAMMGTDEYQTAKEADDAAEMGRLIMQAKTQGMNEYNASEGAQLALESEKTLAEAIRNDASTNQDYWDAGYEKGNWFTKGLAASIGNRSWDYESKGASSPSRLLADYNSHAYGLNYVPYDGYPALLHEGERVMTAAENRNSAAQTITVQVTGNAFSVRSDEDIDAIARQIAVRVREAQDTYGG